MTATTWIPILVSRIQTGLARSGSASRFSNNIDLNTLFEFRTGNYFVPNLSDAFRKSHGLIGLNTPEGAAAEATLRNPAATVDQKFDAAMEWATELKALSPHSGLNTIYNARFLRMREISLAYRVPRSFASKLGLSNLTLSVAGRNLFKWTAMTESTRSPTLRPGRSEAE